MLKELFESKDVIGTLREIGKSSESTSKNNRTRVLTQYISGGGNNVKPTVNTQKVLDAGIYKIEQNDSGIYFEKHNLNTDELLIFEDDRYARVLNEVERFWELRDSFDKMGFTHKRGILLFGTPGTGKSCLTKLVMESMVKRGDIIFIARDSGILCEGLKQFREVEPTRKALVVLEDIDKICEYGEHDILQLFDGDSQIDGILYLSTTNYVEKLPERILRTGRFDSKIEIGNPPLEGRIAYFEQKLGKHESKETIQNLAEKTEGFSFGELREFVVSAFCYKNDIDATINKIKKGLELFSESSERLDLILQEDVNIVDTLRNSFSITDDYKETWTSLGAYYIKSDTKEYRY